MWLVMQNICVVIVRIQSGYSSFSLLPCQKVRVMEESPDGSPYLTLPFLSDWQKRSKQTLPRHSHGTSQTRRIRQAVVGLAQLVVRHIDVSPGYDPLHPHPGYWHARHQAPPRPWEHLCCPRLHRSHNQHHRLCPHSIRDTVSLKGKGLILSIICTFISDNESTSWSCVGSSGLSSTWWSWCSSSSSPASPSSPSYRQGSSCTWPAWYSACWRGWWWWGSTRTGTRGRSTTGGTRSRSGLPWGRSTKWISAENQISSNSKFSNTPFRYFTNKIYIYLGL